VYHHDLAKNYRGERNWGATRHEFCTDENGFKISCSGSGRSGSAFDLVFIGDSFTEGLGLAYEDTFVGRISQAIPSLKIANLGVSSYSPSIYLAKVRYLLEIGYTFKHLIVYIDISDIQDEATSYLYRGGVVMERSRAEQSSVLTGVLSSARSPDLFLNLKSFARWVFPLTYLSLNRVKRLISPASTISYLDRKFERSAWTYNLDSDGYGETGVRGGIDRSMLAMTELSDLLIKHGITLSVGVYPWPGQIKYDVRDSIQVTIWRDFCKNRCKNFYNSFDSFFGLKEEFTDDEIIASYFIAGDVHHDSHGAKVIADDFLRAFTE